LVAKLRILDVASVYENRDLLREQIDVHTLKRKLSCVVRGVHTPTPRSFRDSVPPPTTPTTSWRGKCATGG
jgi:hypothetical protein